MRTRLRVFAIWLVRKLDPAALVLWDLDTLEYSTIRDFMMRRNEQRRSQ
jgi:hypothetical protein